MAQGKIEFSVGNMRFAGEGDENWVAEQLDKVLAAMPTLEKIQEHQNAASNGNSSSGATNQPPGSFTITLASYIREKGAESSQNKRFLATADWVRRRGAPKLSTAMVSKALSENQQKRLGNPADCLNQNVSKGFCEKTGDGFFITPEGLKELGYQ